jgi:hypothetical protein
MSAATKGRRAWLRCGALAALAAILPARAALAQPRLFRSDDTLSVTLRTDLRALLHDRDTSKAPLWRPATLSYAGPDGQVTVPIRVRTRGLYRRSHCDLPPIRLRFSDSTSRGTLFHGLGRPKLVNPCRNGAGYEQYVLEEYAIYRVLRLFTPLSLSARLLRVTYEDSAGRVAPMTTYAFVTEDPDRLAERLGGTFVVPQGMRIGMPSPGNLTLVGTFQYFIGNTDWSIVGRHNIALLKLQDTTFAMPFDFDWSGVINPPYCRPAQVLRLPSCRSRLYHAFCPRPEDLEPLLARFEALRDTIAAIYRSIPGLEPKSVEGSLHYYDEFYRSITDRRRFMDRVVEPECVP